MQPERRTDLAAELDLTDKKSIDERTEHYKNYLVTTVEILTDDAAERIGKSRGKYITVDIGRIWLASDEEFSDAVKIISDKLKLLSTELCGCIPGNVLIIGLGNRHITADALGDETVNLLTVTRHLKEHNTSVFRLLGGREISAIAPGVLGQTGIEAAEIAAGLCERVKPELVIAIDSLCARSAERLATTVQLGSSGITPGSGIGNHRRAINRETLGIPVIALGVPTVVESSTLVLDALEDAGITEPDERLLEVLGNRHGFFVTPKETDTIIRELSRLSAEVLTAVFGGI